MRTFLICPLFLAVIAVLHSSSWNSMVSAFTAPNNKQRTATMPSTVSLRIPSLNHHLHPNAILKQQQKRHHSPLFIAQSPIRSPSSSRQRQRDTQLWNTLDPQDSSTANGSSLSPMEPQLFPQRWIQLAYLSVLALLSDWICFSCAAIPDTYEAAFSHSASSLIDIFLFTNVASCFLVTDVVAKVGLHRAIQGAAVLMAAGTWLRSGISFLPYDDIGGQAHLMTYPFILAGTVMVGAAQPFFQCTPPALSAQWFGPDERATATATALNFNQIGIATAFLVGGAMATTQPGLERYFGLIALLTTAVAVGACLQLQKKPPVPPSASEVEKLLNNEVEPPFIESVVSFFKTRGFSKALVAFICSISVTNVVGTFIDDVMERGGITDQFQVDLAGAGFEIAILLGGIFIGGYVDKTKQYKKVTLACLAASTFLIIPLGLTEHAIGKEPILLLLSLLGLGVAAGPVQPINAELAVDVTYPGDETAVESVQQIGGNLFSALLVPIAEIAAKDDIQLLPNIDWLASDIRGDVVLLAVVSLITIAYFSTFDAPLMRTNADASEESDGLNQEESSLNNIVAVSEEEEVKI